MKNLPFILIFALFFSCSSVEKNNYKILKSYLTDKNRVKNFEENCKLYKIDIPDTIIISSLPRSNRTITRFFFNEKSNLKGLSIWINCKEKIDLTNDDLSNIQNQILKLDSSETFIDRYLTFKNFKVSNDELKNNQQSKNRIIYYLSKPIMILDGGYSLFYVEYYLENQYSLENNYVIMKKNNNKWNYVGELCKNNIID